ncbi:MULTISPECIES: hypothetical protein [unclassified Streptomyces]|uniref:hypothetical protein n=1 Tax=unclassified Streptomyces TaxID=2593676 RepID=UPI002E12CC81|nr:MULTISPECIES: hypothetical protein [unclassified Streptomyces]WSR29177.1 hypothetical protein OG573_42140 [Streptomyces sp. NBC_01205]
MSPAPGSAPPPCAFDVSDLYLRAADEAGVLSHIDGLPVVADEYREPASGELQCLVEYADPALLARAPRLLDALFRRHPGCSSAVVRIPAHLPAPSALQPLLSYLRHAPPPAAAAPAAAPAAASAPFGIAEASDADDEAVGRWLSRAIRDAAADRGHTETAHGAAESVRRLLEAPGRRSYLVRVPGRPEPIGHATLLTDAYDDVSDSPFVELVDILIDDAALRRAATARLVAACADTAAALGAPLIGNVTHPADRAGQDRSARVVAALRRQGWTPTHGYAYAARP